MSAAVLPIPIFVNPSPADALKLRYSRISVPLAKGAFKAVPGIAIKNARGHAVPVQSEILTSWPDKSPRVLHLTFPSSAGDYEAILGGTDGMNAGKNPITIQRDGKAKVTVTSGRLSATLGGTGLVDSIRIGQQEMIGPGGIEVRVTDGHKRAFTASAASDIETIIETEGPLRSVVALKGKCTLGEETFLDFRLRFEFLAGVEGFSLSYSFFNLEPGQDFFDVGSIELELRLANAKPQQPPQHTVYQASYGLFSTLGRVVTTPEPFHIAVDDTRSSAYVTNYDALGDENEYPFYLNPPSDKVDNWAAVSDDKRSLLVEMDDFHLLRPKSLELAANTIRFGIWPREAGTLSLQQGRSRQVTIRVALSDKGAPTSQDAAMQAVAQLRDVWLAQIPQQIYADANFFDQGRVLPFQANVNPRFENWLGNMAFSMNTIATFFDLGDTPDSGYQTTYIPIGNRIRRVRSEDGGQRYFATSLHFPAHKLNGLEDFEPVWVNNEYDVIFCLGTELLRTENLSLFQKLCWWSRHTIDVDFLHYSDHKWLHRATPAHSERHTMTGAYPSHFWSQGLAQYYMLTADPDALEVIIALADKTIENLDDPTMKEICSGLNREIGWGILTMICAFEASGIKRFDAYARELLDREISYGLPDDLSVFSFGHTSILLGARQYLQLHEGNKDAEPVRRWLLDFVDLAIRSSRAAPPPPEAAHGDTKAGYSYDQDMAQRGKVHTSAARSGIFNSHSMALDPIAYAYEITGDENYIKAGMRSIEALIDSQAFRAPTPEGKPYAMVYRTFINFLKSASVLGYLQEYEYKH